MRDERAAGAVVVRATRFGRLLDYLGEMFPPATMVPSGLSLFASVYLGLQALAGRHPLAITGRAIGGAISFVLFLLLLRVYDEFKDLDADTALGKAGDPRYKDRATVTGRVTRGDLEALRNYVVASLFVVNVLLGFPWPFLAFALTFAACWLSSRWFYWPAISKSLLLALATHNPLGLVFVIYAASVYVADDGPRRLGGTAVLLLLAVYLPTTAWETARKVRIPADETAYQTYSKVLGLRVAALLPAVFVSASAACLVPVAYAAGLGHLYAGLVVAAAALVPAAGIRLLVRPSRAAANLRPWVETYGLVVTIGFVIALLVKHGVIAVLA